MIRKNGKLVKVIAFFVCAVLLAAIAGVSYAAGLTWSQTGVGTGSAYRISLSPNFRTDRTAFWVWGDTNICKTTDGFSRSLHIASAARSPTPECAPRVHNPS